MNELIGVVLVVLGTALIGLRDNVFNYKAVNMGLLSAFLYASSYVLRKLGVASATPIIGALITILTSMAVLAPLIS